MADGALAVRQDQMSWSPEQMAALRQLGVEKATAGDLSLFLSYSQRTGLDPFSRQIYMIGRWDGRNKTTKFTIQASIDGLRIVAQRSGEYEGQTEPQWFDGQQWHEVWMGPGNPVAAKVGVWRKGFREPLYAVALWAEYAQEQSPMWHKMPALMLAKCAEALALRKAFPNDLSGIYTAEEMAQADSHPAPSPEPFLTSEEVVLSVKAAETEDELRECWRQARRAGHLGVEVPDPWTGEVVTIGALIPAARERLLDEQPVEGEVVGEAEDASDSE